MRNLMAVVLLGLVVANVAAVLFAVSPFVAAFNSAVAAVCAATAVAVWRSDR